MTIDVDQNVSRLVAYYGRPDQSPELARACFYTEDDFQAFEADSRRKPRRAPAQQCLCAHAASHQVHHPLGSQAVSDDGDLFYHEGTKGFVGDQVNAFVYQIGLAS